MSLTVAEIKALIESIKVHVQCDDYDLIRTDDGLLYIFPISGSDPEHVMEELEVSQWRANNIVNLDHLKDRIDTDDTGYLAGLFPLNMDELCPT